MIFLEWGRLCLQSKLFDSLGTRRVLLLSLFTCYMVSDYLRSHGLQPTRLLCPWDSPGKGTGVGCHFLLQGIFQTRGLNLGLLHCRRILYHYVPPEEWLERLSKCTRQCLRVVGIFIILIEGVSYIYIYAHIYVLYTYVCMSHIFVCLFSLSIIIWRFFNVCVLQ